MTKESLYVIGLTYFVSYIVFSLILFGNIFKPIACLFFWKFIRIPIELLVISLSAGFVIALLIYFLLKVNWVQAYKLLVALISFGITSIIVAAALSSAIRTQKIAELAPDKIETNNFIKSLHNTPKDFQFYTHAIAVKDCKHYAWSYRELDFYELPDSIARNVTHGEWYNECNKVLPEPRDNE